MLKYKTAKLFQLITMIFSISYKYLDQEYVERIWIKIVFGNNTVLNQVKDLNFWNFQLIQESYVFIYQIGRQEMKSWVDYQL